MDPRNGGPGSPFGFPFQLQPGAYPFHPQLGLDGRMPDPRYNWDPRLMGLPAHGGSPILGEMPFGRLPADSTGRAGDAAAFLHPAYPRMSPFWEQMYRHAMHANSLRGMPIDTRGPMSPDYLRQATAAGLAPGSDVFSMHAASATPSMGIPFSNDGSRITTPRPSSLSRLGRKRPLSISPFGQDFDLNTVIRMSPNSLISGGNGSRCSSSASGTYGHLAAGTMSPSMALDPVRFQQFQQYMMRQNAQTFFPSAFYPPGMSKLAAQTPSNDQEDVHMVSPAKREHLKRDLPSHGVVSSSVNPPDNRRKEKVKKEPAQSTSTVDDEDDGHFSPNRSQDPDQEDDFIETHCRWAGCDMDFETQDELVAHVNQDHVSSNKKTFICRWIDCCREEKPFKAQYMLVVHMRRHTGEKPHKCTYNSCNKAYSRLENLKTHLRSHTGERPYMCEFPGCTKAFSNASDRAKHQNRTHSNAKPYVCKFPGCTKRYTDPSSLRKHVKTVHGADYMSNKKHKANDVPRKHRFDEGDGHGHGGGEDSTRSSKSFSGSEPSTPRGNIKQESVEMSPSYSLPPSVFTNCPQDSPGSMDYHLQNQNSVLSLNNRSNDPIAEEENELDPPDQNGLFGGPELAVAARPNRYAMRGPLCQKPAPPLSLGYAPRSPAQSGPVVMSELSECFTRTFIEPREQYFTPIQEARRDSNVSMSSAYYSSVPSDGSRTLSANTSRRASEVSLGFTPQQNSPPYDPISVGSSRRSSEPSLAGTLSGYQQKMQMRSMQAGQRWQPAPPQPARVPSVQPAGNQGTPQYHGTRRASAPVMPVNQPQHTQPLTRRNLLRHNSLSSGSSSSVHPIFTNDRFLNFEENTQEEEDSEGMEEHETSQLVIPEDMVRYLQQYGERHQMDTNDDEDNDLDLPPTIQQNYAEGLNQAYLDTTTPSTFTSYPPAHPCHHGQRSASFTNAYPQNPSNYNGRGQQGAPAYQSMYSRNAGQQRQRRASLQCVLPSSMPRPLTEGSPDSYEVTSTTTDGRQELRYSSYNAYQGHNGGAAIQGNQQNGGNGHLQSGTVVADMQSMLSSLDHENRLLNSMNSMVQ